MLYLNPLSNIMSHILTRIYLIIKIRSNTRDEVKQQANFNPIGITTASSLEDQQHLVLTCRVSSPENVRAEFSLLAHAHSQLEVFRPCSGNRPLLKLKTSFKVVVILGGHPVLSRGLESSRVWERDQYLVFKF